MSPGVLKALAKAINAWRRDLVHGGRVDDARSLPERRPASRAISASTGCSAARRSTRSWISSTAADTEYYPSPVVRPAIRPSSAALRPKSRPHCRDVRRKGLRRLRSSRLSRDRSGADRAGARARRGLGPDKYLIVAGAVTSAERIRAIEAAGADAFTIGTAVFNGSYSPSKGSILSQLRDVLADCGDRLTVAVVGIDIGTQSLKVVVVDAISCRAASASVPYRP